MRGLHDSADASANTQRALTWVVFLGCAGVVLYLCVSILRPLAGVIAWSAVLAIVCYPVHQRLVRRTGRVGLSAFITSMLTVLACVVPLLLLSRIAVSECIALGHSLQATVNGHSEPLRQISAPLAWITTRLGVDDAAIRTSIQQHISELAGGVGRYTLSIATGVLDVVVSSVLVIVALFLLLRDGEAIVQTIPDLLPFERHRSEALLRRIQDVVQASVYGVVVIAVLQGALCGVMLWLLGIPSAALWGLVTMFASLLPVVGGFAVWGPATAYLALTGAWPRAVVLAIWGTFVVSGVDNVLRPRLVAGRVGLSELAMLFAMLGGVSVFGGLGIVLGPVVFATAAAIVDTLRVPQADPSAAAPSSSHRAEESVTTSRHQTSGGHASK
jgi:predicted PurR-regulated permease PerM